MTFFKYNTNNNNNNNIIIIYMKIFAIGFNKTGTTSLYELFISLGINSIHNSDKDTIDVIDLFDAITDGTHDNFNEYYTRYPDGLFILNTRPIFKWLVSRYKHGEHHDFEECWCWPISDEKTNEWITHREWFYEKVLNFFLDKPKQLLIVNIEKEGWENVVTKFIQYPCTSNKHHENKRDLSNYIDKITLITENVSKCLKERGYSGDELMAKDIDVSLYEYETFL